MAEQPTAKRRKFAVPVSGLVLQSDSFSDLVSNLSGNDQQQMPLMTEESQPNEQQQQHQQQMDIDGLPESMNAAEMQDIDGEEEHPPQQAMPDIIDLISSDDEDGGQAVGGPPPVVGDVSSSIVQPGLFGNVPLAGSAIEHAVMLSSDEEEEGDGSDVMFAQVTVTVAGVAPANDLPFQIILNQRLVAVRQPFNEFDPNAIRFQTCLSDSMVGYARESESKLLAPFMDAMDRKELRNVRLEFYSLADYVYVKGASHNNLSVTLRIFINNFRDTALKDRIRRLQRDMSSLHDLNGRPYRKVSEQELEAKAMKDLEHFEGNIEFLENMPSKEPDRHIVTTRLFDYQKQGLWWMTERERKFELIHDPDRETQVGMLFWIQAKHPRTGDMVYYNSVSREVRLAHPRVMRGGILADDMGLGKTLQMIACIAENRGGMATLIVCSKSLMNNWVDQISAHTRPDALTVCVYYGASTNSMTKDQLESHDVVITTYEVVASDHERSGLRRYKKTRKEEAESKRLKRLTGRIKRKGLMAVHFGRVVLDEAHFIRNATSYRAQACYDIWADVRWALTGTPIQNKLDDFYSLMKFLGADPLCNRDVWMANVGKKKKTVAEAERAVGIMRQVMRDTCLRRLKAMKFRGQPLVSLPPKHEVVTYVKMLAEEAKVYGVMQKEAKQIFQMLLQKDLIRSRYGFILVMLLRLRQCCDSRDLVPEKFIGGFRELLNDLGGEKGPRTAQQLAMARKMIETVKANLKEGCAICLMDQAEDPVSTSCCHVFCRACIEESLSSGNKACPLCREVISKKMLVGLDLEAEVKEEEEMRRKEEEEAKKKNKRKRNSKKKTGTVKLTPSGKISSLIADLMAIKKANPAEKSVVFSQWSSMLRLIAAHIDELPLRERIPYALFTGDMSHEDRGTVLRSFCDPASKCKVLLISLGCGNVGLNLTVANHLFMMDPWWNPFVEQQARDRVYRVGQTREVTVTRYAVEDSVEDRVMNTQRKKRRTVNQIMGASDSSDQLSRAQLAEEMLADLKHIFGIAENPEEHGFQNFGDQLLPESVAE